MTAWQPIATAPRDGSRVMVWRPDEGDGHHFAHADVDFWRPSSWWKSRRAQQPTHWMPLPEPPQNDLPELADANQKESITP